MNNRNYQKPPDSSVNLTELLYRLIDKAFLIVIVSVACAFLMGKIGGTGSVTTYYSTAKLYLINSDSDSVSMAELQAASYLVNDYLAVFQTKELHRIVAETLDSDYTADELSSMVSASEVTDTHIIGITVRADSAEDAEKIAGTYARVARILIGKKLNLVRPSIFEEATPAKKVVTSNARQNYLMGALVGVFVSAGAVVLGEIVDDHIYTPEDIIQCADVETIGIITRQRKLRSAKRRGK